MNFEEDISSHVSQPLGTSKPIVFLITIYLLYPPDGLMGNALKC